MGEFIECRGCPLRGALKGHNVPGENCTYNRAPSFAEQHVMITHGMKCSHLASFLIQVMASEFAIPRQNAVGSETTDQF